MNDIKNKLYLEANITVHKETEALRERASAAITLPDSKLKQPDLLYFSAIFVSSGENLNHAYFLPSELLKAENTIINKALDVEHKEEDIVGHIYERVFMGKDGSALDISNLATANKLDSMDIHVGIAGIVYKSRFPNLAQEIADNRWKVSMEAYFTDFDVKVGDLIINKNEAEVLGIASNDKSLFGKLAKVIKGKEEIASGTLTRVLRGIVFSGCGFVKHAANPPSIVLETANTLNKEVNEDGEIIIDYDVIENKGRIKDNYNNVTSVNIGDSISEIIVEKTDKNKEEAQSGTDAIDYDDTVGICVNFKRWVHEGSEKGPDTNVLHENWCTLYDRECTSFSRDTTDPDCLRNKLGSAVKSIASKLIEKRNSDDKRKERMSVLNKVLVNAAKYLDKEE